MSELPSFFADIIGWRPPSTTYRRHRCTSLGSLNFGVRVLGWLGGMVGVVMIVIA
jgi:hypothetical protein